MPLTRDVSSVMLNSCSGLQHADQGIDKCVVFDQRHIHMCAVMGQSASRAIQWCRRWSLAGKDPSGCGSEGQEKSY